MYGKMFGQSGKLIMGLVFYCSLLIALSGADKHVLKQDGKINCVVVVPDDAGPVAKFAGKELQDVLSQALAGEVPLVKEPDMQKTSIIIGNSKQFKAVGGDVAKLQRDGFVIKSNGNNILIAGRDDMTQDPAAHLKAWAQRYERGTLFGVYDFLERFAGVRFYFPGEVGTIVPNHENLALPGIDIVSKPDFTVRRISGYSGTDLEGRTESNVESLPFRNLNYFRLRFETQYLPCCHSLERLGYLKRFEKEHPDYLAMDKFGKRITDHNSVHAENLCFTSSGFRDELYKDAEAFLTGKSAASRNIVTKYGQVWDSSAFQPGYFNIMARDWFTPCWCDDCQKYYKSKEIPYYFDSPGSGELYWNLVADISNRLQKNNISGHVTAMAYAHTKKLPSVTLPSNVLVMVSATGPWSMRFPNVRDFDSSIISGWGKKIGGKVWLWNAMYKLNKLDIPNVPQMTPKAVGEFYKSQKNNIIGAFIESETDKFIYNYLNFYVFSKIAWDNSTDVDALLKEHYSLMFGKGAPQMEKAYNIFEDNWFGLLGQPIETPLGPSATGISEYELWEKVYSQKAVDELAGLFDEAEKATTDSPEHNKRVKYMRAQLLNPLVAQRNTYFQNKVEINDLSFHLKAIPDGQVINIDGKLDEAVWKNCDKIYLTPFAKNKLQKDSLIKTIVYGLQDKDKLYFAFECEEPRMGDLKVVDRKYDDQDIWRDSSVEIFLNPSGDKEAYFQILVNPAGSLSDLSGKKMGSDGSMNWNWNSGAKVAAVRNQNSWTVEIEIPIKNLEGFTGKDIPANFNRNRVLKNAGEIAALFTWTPFLKNGFHEIENFGMITFQEGKSPIVKNGGFSSKKPDRGQFFDGWYAPDPKDLQNGGAWDIVPDDFTKSGSCLILKSESKDTKLCVTQYLPVLKSDTKYLLAYSVKIENLQINPSGGVCVNVGDVINMWFPKTWYNTDMPWTRQGFQFTTGHDTNKDKKAFMRLWIMNASGSAYFGDVSIKEIK